MKITNFVSHYFGKVASYQFSTPIQNFINRRYVKLFGVDLGEFDEVCSYSSLNELFTRSLRVAREIDRAEYIFPCDGVLSVARSTKSDQALQVKGFYYSLSELIDDEFKAGSYSTIYLSPKDYHRFHAPTDFSVQWVKFLEGSLLPVNSFSVSNFKELFIRNERVVMKCIDSKGVIFYLVFVGALNVGSVKINGIDRVSNVNDNRCFFEPDMDFKKGDELGYFQMGSTIVTVFEKEVAFKQREGSRVRFGEGMI